MMKESVGGLLACGRGSRLTSHKSRYLRFFYDLSILDERDNLQKAYELSVQ